jgi:hypothetical protein
LTSFYHPYEIVPKDDVIVCTPPASFPVETVFYVIVALNSITWRFSYYRKAYPNKVDKINVYMPVTASGKIDHTWLRRVAHSCIGWGQLTAAMPTWRPAPFVSLGKSGSAADPAPGYSRARAPASSPELTAKRSRRRRPD